MSEEERRRINPFDYERAFGPVFKQGDLMPSLGIHRISGCQTSMNR